MSQVRVPFVYDEPLTEGAPNIRVPFVYSEPLSGGIPNVRVAFNYSEPLTDGYPHVRIGLIYLEALVPIPEDLPMATDPFPGFGNSSIDPSVPQALDPFNSALPGLDISVHKKPEFKTRRSEAASMKEIVNAMAQYPRWNFELTYNFLRDTPRSAGESSLHTILGFFLSRLGGFADWLFKDPDDYLVVNGSCGPTDGVTTEYVACRPMGGYLERVGQIDTANTINLYLTVGEDGTIPATGPYTITVAQAASFVEDLGVTRSGIPMVKSSGPPASGHYSVDVLTGIYTFNSTDGTDLVTITYRYDIDPSDYTVTIPNLFVFDSAPPEGVLSWDGQFYFVCRFLEDELDFEKFADKLWTLQQCNFRSVIQ